jgi:multidrug efflux pump subunit AcrA (membrane-fusion protein)
MHRYKHEGSIKAGAIALALALLSSCFLLPEEEEVLAPPIVEPPKVRYRTVETTRETIERKAYLLGYLEPAVSEILFTEKTGRLASIFVEEGDKVGKGDVLAETALGSLPIQLEQRKIALQKKELIGELKKLQGADRYELRLAGLDVTLAKLQLDDIKGRIAGAQLVAPFSGIVKDIYVDEGSVVEAYRDIIRIVDPGRVILRAKAGKDSEHFLLGMTVQVRIKNKMYDCKIVEVPDVDAKSTFTAKDDYFTMEVYRLPPNTYDPSTPTPGMIAMVLERSENALVLPKSAVHQFSGRSYVKTLAGGLVEEKYIDVGIQTSTEMEILSGVEEGQIIVLD